jgi:hypothetical protein
MKTLLIIAGLLAATCGFSSPSTNQPTIRVQFLSMTNNTAGAKLARFELRNTGKESWDVSLPGFSDNRLPGICTVTNLQAGASLETSVQAPMGRDSWRAEFICGRSTEQTASYHIYSDHVYSEYLPPNTALEPTPIAPPVLTKP